MPLTWDDIPDAPKKDPWDDIPDAPKLKEEN